MINLDIELNNPWAKGDFQNFYCKEDVFAKNKAYDFEILHEPQLLLKLGLHFNQRCDHAGLRFEFGLLGYSILLGYYDTRHWDHEKDCWHVYEQK